MRRCLRRSLIQPRHGDGDDVVFERLVGGQEDASLQSNEVRGWRGGGVSDHDEGKILSLATAVMDFHGPRPCTGQHTGRNTDALNVVDVVSSTAGGGEAAGKIVAEPAGPVGGDQHKVEVVDQAGAGRAGGGAAWRVGPCQRDVDARGRVKIERIQQAVACTKAWAVVQEGGEHRAAGHRANGPVEIDVAPTFGAVWNVGGTDVLCAVDEHRLDEGGRGCRQASFLTDVLSNEGCCPSRHGRGL